MTRLVLASTSPQRRAILEQLGVPFAQVAPVYTEEDGGATDPIELVRAHALGKASSVHRRGQVTLGVDTLVALDGVVYGKPDSEPAARAMLSDLAGRSHEVISGICLLGAGDPMLSHASTAVTFRAAAPEEIDAYLASGEWQGRAGGYAIQGLGARLVTMIEGDYLNVVGLPGAALVDILTERCPALLATVH
jgi:septum formation protein